MLLRFCRKTCSALSLCNDGGIHHSLHRQLAPETLSVWQRNTCTVDFCRHNHTSDNGVHDIIRREEPKEFHERLNFYRDAAQRSVLVILDKEAMVSSCRAACLSFGSSQMKQISSNDSNCLRFLVTFSRQISATKFITSVNSGNDFPTRVVGFGCNMKKRKHIHPPRRKKVRIPNNLSLDVQMSKFSSSCKTPQIEILKRFFVCQYVEDLVKSVYPSVMVIPFGSSVSNIGTCNGDLDMSLQVTRKESRHSPWKPENANSDSILHSVEKIMRVSLPSCKLLLNLSHAVVPILKFHHLNTDLMCDLSFGNSEGIYMTSWLYTLTQYDKRFPVLARVIKEWARNNLSTIRNTFFLQMMMVFFLQTEKVLPTLEEMMTEDFDKIAPPVLQNISWKMDMPKSTNQKPVDVLLKEFFQFYTALDFSCNGMNIRNGCLFNRSGGNQMLLPNPFVSEKSSLYNVCRNIPAPHFTNIRMQMENTLERWEQSESPNLKYILDNKNKDNDVKSEKNVGLEIPVEEFEKLEPVTVN